MKGSRINQVIIRRAISKYLNMLVVIAMLIPNITGAQSVQAAPAPEEILSQPIPTQSKGSYQAPVFTHPEARVGDRSESGKTGASASKAQDLANLLPPDSNCLDGQCVIWVDTSMDDAGDHPFSCSYIYLPL